MQHTRVNAYSEPGFAPLKVPHDMTKDKPQDTHALREPQPEQRSAPHSEPSLTARL